LPWLARALSGCHERPHVERSLGGLPFDCAAYHVGLADFHAVGDDILQMLVCLRVRVRDGKEAVEPLKAMSRYPELEALGEQRPTESRWTSRLS
jgi:hypothetical protein